MVFIWLYVASVRMVVGEFAMGKYFLQDLMENRRSFSLLGCGFSLSHGF